MTKFAKPPLTDAERALCAEIDAMTHEQMAHRWRYAPPGDAYFRGAVGAYFTKRFESFGGMTPSASKSIGWEARNA